MNYRQQRAHDFARHIKALGFRVYLAKGGEYGFITDDTGDRVLSFSFSGVPDTLGGNYGPPSRESGTGWQHSEGPEALRTARDVRRFLDAYPPPWAGRGWSRLTTVAEHLAAYGQSSGYVEFEGEA